MARYVSYHGRSPTDSELVAADFALRREPIDEHFIRLDEAIETANNELVDVPTRYTVLGEDDPDFNDDIEVVPPLVHIEHAVPLLPTPRMEHTPLLGLGPTPPATSSPSKESGEKSPRT